MNACWQHRSRYQYTHDFVMREPAPSPKNHPQLSDLFPCGPLQETSYKGLHLILQILSAIPSTSIDLSLLASLERPALFPLT